MNKIILLLIGLILLPNIVNAYNTTDFFNIIYTKNGIAEKVTIINFTNPTPITVQLGGKLNFTKLAVKGIILSDDIKLGTGYYNNVTIFNITKFNVTNQVANGSISNITQLINKTIELQNKTAIGSYLEYHAPDFNSNAGWINIIGNETIRANTSYLIKYTIINKPQIGNVALYYESLFNFSGTIIILDPWFNSSWGKRRNVTIINNVGSALNNFTVMINVTSQTGMLANFTDVLFTNAACDSDNAQLNHEIDNYTSSNYALMWVKIPSFTTPNITICMYFNNTLAGNQQNIAGTWDNDYIAVWHLSETSPPYKDSTKYGQNMTTTGTPISTETLCSVGRCLSFPNGLNNYTNITTTQYIPIGANKSSMDGIVRFWSTVSSRIQPIVGWGTSTSSGLLREMYAYNFWTTIHWGIDSAWNTPEVNKTYGFAYVYNGTHDLFYENGTLAVNVTTINKVLNTNIGQPIYLARSTYESSGANLLLDEVRISNNSRSASWESAVYQSEVNYTNLLSFGNIETQHITNSILIYQYANMSNLDNYSIVWKLNIVVFNNDSVQLNNISIDGSNNFSISNYTIDHLVPQASNLSQFSYNLTRQNISSGGQDVIINVEPAKIIDNASGTSNALTLINPVDPPDLMSYRNSLLQCWTRNIAAKSIWIPLGCLFKVTLSSLYGADGTG